MSDSPAIPSLLSIAVAAELLIDHQSGLISLEQDHGPDECRHNVLALA